MAKEMMIVFVYDTEICKDEADDPVKAVLYFHPSWVSDVQKVLLCGQLMGTTHFLANTFIARPKVISLQSGKFVLKEFGRFILAVGTDRNLSKSILEHRAELLTSLVTFFHRDIQTMYDQFSSGSGGVDGTATGPISGNYLGGQPYKSLSEKLYHIFETYLPILQYNGNIFQNMPISRLPKSASNIFLEAMQTLQSCQQTKGVLGGSMLFHNKVIATQLSPDLTKNLVLTDPHRIKSTAESISVDFHIPVGVQLIVVYIPIKDYRKLTVDSQRAQAVTNQTANNQATAGIIPFQFKKKMKRDKSIIFTNIPEEGAPEGDFAEIKSIPSKSTITSRPNHLPLRFKNITSKDLPESGFSSINFDESDSFPQFIGKTSVCSTPMTEMKVLHGAVLSICANSDVPEEPVTETVNSPKKSPAPLPMNFITNPFRTENRRHSLTNMQDSMRKIRLVMRPFGHGLAKLGAKFNHEHNGSPVASPSDDIEIEDFDRKTYRTITDPMYPVFNSDGAPISKCLFQDYLKQLNGSHEPDQIVPEIAEDALTADSNYIDGFDSEMKMSPVHQAKVEPDESNSKPIVPNRVSLSLPLKSLTLDGLKEEDNAPSTSAGGANMFEMPAHRKKLAGIQLTPLMTKLSILAMNDERSSGFSSWDTTPGGFIDQSTPGNGDAKLFRRRSSIKYEDVAEFGDGGENQMQKCELFICGQQNMTLLLLMDESYGRKHELVQAMFDICVARLTRIETHLSQTLNVNVDGDKNDGGGYSFLSMDPHWDTLQRAGPWSQVDISTLECMRSNFRSGFGITDMILRTDESVLYGYQYGDSNIFYKQNSNAKQGLPPPADAMGTVPINAKRRLERDHSIILL